MMDALTRSRLVKARARGDVLFVAPSSARDGALGAYTLSAVREGQVIGQFPTEHGNVASHADFEKLGNTDTERRQRW